VVYDASPTSAARQKRSSRKGQESENGKEESKPKSLMKATPDEMEMEKQRNAIRRERFITSKGLDKTPKEMIHRMGEKEITSPYQTPAKNAKTSSHVPLISSPASASMMSTIIASTAASSAISSSHSFSATPFQRRRRFVLLSVIQCTCHIPIDCPSSKPPC
jgi:hypothetical protein